MTNKQIMAELANNLLFSELKQPAKLTNNGVVYNDTTTINSRSINMGNYNGSSQYQSMDLSTICLDKKIITIAIDFHRAGDYASNYCIVNALDPLTNYGLKIYYDSVHGLTIAIYNGSTTPVTTVVYRNTLWTGAVWRFVFVLDYEGTPSYGDQIALFRYKHDTGGGFFSTGAVTWLPMQLSSSAKLGTDLTTYHDGGLYDFAIYNYQNDSFLRNFTELEIANAIYNNDWRDDGSYAFTHEYTFFQDIFWKENKTDIYKVELKKRHITGLLDYDTAFTDITSYVAEDGIGDLEKGLKDDEALFGMNITGSMELKVNNRLGTFNDETDNKSMFYGYAIADSYIRVSLGFEYAGINYLLPVFKGIISAEDISRKGYPDASILLLHYSKLFDARYVHEINVGRTNALSAQSFTYQMLKNFITDYGAVFGIALGGVAVKNDYIIDFANNISKTQYEMLEDVLKNTGSILNDNLTNLSVNYFANAVSQQPGSFYVDANTQALYTFDDTGSTMYDKSANGNNLTLAAGANPPTIVQGMYGGALKYDISTRRDFSRGAMTGVPNNTDCCYEFLIRFEKLNSIDNAMRPFFEYGVSEKEKYRNQIALGINREGGLNIWGGGQSNFYGQYTHGMQALIVGDTYEVVTGSFNGHVVGDQFVCIAADVTAFASSSAICYYITDITPIIVNGVIGANLWYYLKVNIDYTNNKIDVYVQNKLVGSRSFTLRTDQTYNRFHFDYNLNAPAYTIDTFRVSNICRNLADGEIMMNKIFANSQPLGQNIGTFNETGYRPLLLKPTDYDDGRKQVKNFCVMSLTSNIKYYVNFKGTIGGSSLFYIYYLADPLTYTTYNCSGFSSLRQLVTVINNDTDTHNCTAEYVEADGSVNIYSSKIDISDRMNSYCRADYWTNPTFNEPYMQDASFGYGIFSNYYDVKSLIVKDDTSINLHGRKLMTVDNEVLPITDNQQLIDIGQMNIDARSTQKFSLEFEARYLALFPFKLFDKCFMSLDRIWAISGAYNNALMRHGSVANNIPGGWIPWAGVTIPEGWIASIMISRNSNKMVLRARKV